jgi:hypothetical protein
MGRCRPAAPDEVPHGANEFIQLEEQSIEQMRGTVFLNHEPARDIVVEIYDYTGTDSYDDLSRALKEQQRIAACVTGPDGKFSFSGLGTGTYLLRAGTRLPNGINETHVIVSLGTGAPYKNRRLKIVLTLGT